MSLKLQNRVTELEQVVMSLVTVVREQGVLITELKGYISPLLVSKSLKKPSAKANIAETQKAI